MHKLGILLSGRGSNFLAIADAIERGELPAEIAVVLSNKPEAPGLAAARERGVAAFAIPQSGKGLEARAVHDAAMILALQQHGVDLVCLAGYMRIISPAFVAAFPERILNVHPSLLPSFPGLEAQTQAFAAGVKLAGCTVHFVDEKVDHGVIILQRAVPVLDDDSGATLSARILVQEHQAYPEAISRVLSGEYEIVGRHYRRKSATDSRG
jgi:phosphoribosylglycinamide formyltransferase-1